MTRVIVAGIGSEYRRDDGVGVAVACEVEAMSRAAGGPDAAIAIAPLSDPIDLLGRWDGADLAIVVDATRSGRPPGTVRVRRLDGLDAPVGATGAPARSSTHGLGIDDVLRLSRCLGSAPAQVVLVGIEGEDFGFGQDMSPPIVAAVPQAVQSVLELIEAARPCV